MSNALFPIYGTPTSSPWFPRLRQLRCERPRAELRVLDRQFPAESALYFLCANRGISYIGISGTRASGGLFGRLRTHWLKSNKHFRFVYAFGLPVSCLVEWENEAIGHFRPEENFRGRNLRARVNDELDGLAGFLDRHAYHSLYADFRRFRIDLEYEPQPQSDDAHTNPPRRDL